MRFQFIVKIKDGQRSIKARCWHKSGGEAIAEVCETLGIAFPRSASVRRIA